MSIQSPCGIFLQPQSGGTITLVPTGGWLERLPDFAASQGVFESDGVNLSAAFFRPLGNVEMTMTFTTEVDHPDLAAALDAFLAASTVSAREVLEIHGTVSISSPIGGIANIADAVVTVVTPELPSGRAATVTRLFTIRASIPFIIPPLA